MTAEPSYGQLQARIAELEARVAQQAATTHPDGSASGSLQEGGSYSRRNLLKGLAVGGAATVLGTAFTAPSVAEAATNGSLKVYDVTASPYSADNSGSSDARNAIQRAINQAASDGGGIVFLPQGTYRLDDRLNINGNGITFMGAGPGATILKTSTSWLRGNVVVFSSVSQGSVRMLSFESADYRTAGATVRLHNASQIYVQDVNMSRQHIGCYITGSGVLHYIDRGYWTSFNPGGYGIAVNSSNTNDTFISNITMDNSSDISKQPRAGILIRRSRAFWLHACDIIRCRNGLLIDTPDNGVVSWGFATNCAFDTSGHRGMLINPAANARVAGLTFVNCWSASSSSYDGCYVGGPVDGCQFIGHRFVNNSKGNGLHVTAPAKNVYVDSCIASGSPSGSGFVFINSARSFAVRDSHSGPYGGLPGNGSGITVQSGCNDYMLTGNNCMGNGAIGINDAGGPNKQVGHNLG